MKLIKIGFLILLLGVCSYASNSKYFNPSVKVGMNIGWIEAEYSSQESGKCFLYPRPYIGLSNEVYFFKSLFIQNDLAYVDNYSVYRYFPPADITMFLHDKNKFIIFSILPGIKFQDYFKITLGYEIATLIKSDNFITEGKIDDKDKYYIKKKYPKTEYAFLLGIAKNFKINNLRLFAETRLSYSMTKFSDEINNKKCKSHKIYFLLGYNL